jgi:hypothetical protein
VGAGAFAIAIFRLELLLRSGSNFFQKSELTFHLRRATPPQIVSHDNLRSKTGKIFFSFWIFGAPVFFFKKEGKFFGFGSPVSFPKEPDAESRGSGGRGRNKKILKIH